MKARSQIYASEVHDKVDSANKQSYWSDYEGFCYRLPFILRENGLLAAFGFLAAKGKTENHRANASLQLLQDYAALFLHAKLTSENDVDVMQDEIRQADLAQYRRMTQHALMLSEWFKRYAEGRDDK